MGQAMNEDEYAQSHVLGIEHAFDSGEFASFLGFSLWYVHQED